MKNVTRRLASVLAGLLGLLAGAIAQAVSLPQCITDSLDAANIIESAPCGVYGIVTSRQANATGNVLDVTVPYMAHLPMGAPKAVVMLFAGGNGNTGIQGNDSTGEVTNAGNNFLVRSAQLFAEHGYLAVTIDRPSDTISFTNDQFDQYRVSPSHAQDIIAVLKEVNFLYGTGHLDLFLAGTSRGAISVVAQNMLGIGSMLSSPVTSASGSGQSLWVGSTSTHPRLVPDFMTVPAHVLAHMNDGCVVSTPPNSQLLHDDFLAAGVGSALDVLNGGFEINLDPCQATTFHGFLGIENSAVQETTTRMNFLRIKKLRLHPRNIKPRARNGRFSTAAGVPIVINLATLTWDLNGDALSHSLAHQASSRGGTLAKKGPFVLYTPPVGGSNLADGFVYVVSDGKGGKNAGIASIRVH